jgi:hypothetical protein
MKLYSKKGTGRMPGQRGFRDEENGKIETVFDALKKPSLAGDHGK